MEYCVYILHSEKLSRFYIGYTSDLDVRMSFHKSADSRKFTYRADDWILFISIICTSQRQALCIENHIKKMKSSTYINNLKKYPEITQKLLVKYNL